MENTESKKEELGSAHPISILSDKIAKIFTSIGFDIADGSELEREWYNFDALNVPKDHPSRDMQDTFFLKLKEDEKNGKAVLRTHTSSVQIRYMTDKIKDARRIIIKDLKEAKLLTNQAPIKHAVNVHERCGTEIEFIKSKQW
jgi:phenylalanyl-tRNA synthetase alpha chain